MEMNDRQRSYWNLIIGFCRDLENTHRFYLKRYKEKGESNDMLAIEAEIMKAFYEHTKNPLFVWRGLSVCIEGDIPLPEWIKNYFSNAAGNLIDSAYNYNPEDKREKELLANALHFKSSGSSNNFKQFKDFFEKTLKEIIAIEDMRKEYPKITETEQMVAKKRFPINEANQDSYAKSLNRLRNKLEKIVKTSVNLG